MRTDFRAIGPIGLSDKNLILLTFWIFFHIIKKDRMKYEFDSLEMRKKWNNKVRYLIDIFFKLLVQRDFMMIDS